MKSLRHQDPEADRVPMPHPQTRAMLERAMREYACDLAMLGVLEAVEKGPPLHWLFAAGLAGAKSLAGLPDDYPDTLLALSHGQIYIPEARWKAALSAHLEQPVEDVQMIAWHEDGKVAGVLCLVAQKTLAANKAHATLTLADLAAAVGGLEKERACRIRAEKHQSLMTGIFNSTTEGVWSVGLDGLITFVNDAAVKLFAFKSAEQMLGKNSHELVHHRYADGSPYPQALCPIFRAFKEGVPAHLTDEVLWRADGTSFCAEYRTTPIFVEGKITGTVTTFSDNTLRRIAEQKISDHAHRLAVSISDLEAERALRERFISTLTHDLRAPIAAALLAAELLPRKVDGNPVVKRICDRIANSMKRAENLIRNLLDVNRIRAGKKIPIDVKDVQLDALLEGGVSELNQIHGPRVVLQNSLGRVDGRCDANGVLRVLDNLVGNAIKYGSDEDPVTVSLRAAGDKVAFSVHNVGNPVPQSEQEGLFEPYYRSDSALAGGQKGWGLGLTLVREIIESHGGCVWLQSSKHEGTTFHVELPVNAESQ